jgi:hypothetical protein
MGKLIKYLFFLAVIAALAGGGSYAAAYFAQGKIASVDNALGKRDWVLAWKGLDSLPGKPRAWVFTYHDGQVPGVKNATIIVSLTGTVLLTKPKDLQARVEHWRDNRQSVE